jgi:hypothetical protein
MITSPPNPSGSSTRGAQPRHAPAVRVAYQIAALSYAHRLGYTHFNAGVTLKVKPDQSKAMLAKRIISEVEVGWLIRAALSRRDRVLLKSSMREACAYPSSSGCRGRT